MARAAVGMSSLGQVAPCSRVGARGAAGASPVPRVEVKVTICHRALPERVSIAPGPEPELTIRLPAPEDR